MNERTANVASLILHFGRNHLASYILIFTFDADRIGLCVSVCVNRSLSKEHQVLVRVCDVCTWIRCMQLKRYGINEINVNYMHIVSHMAITRNDGRTQNAHRPHMERNKRVYLQANCSCVASARSRYLPISPARLYGRISAVGYASLFVQLTLELNTRQIHQNISQTKPTHNIITNEKREEKCSQTSQLWKKKNFGTEQEKHLRWNLRKFDGNVPVVRGINAHVNTTRIWWRRRRWKKLYAAHKIITS